ncbi:response regulator transcription factor [Legionella sainthelensi]|uniref:DNA-binding response regulator n=1 Tax=Legionella sainthelensi TaxID=28087 RepID=A0A2H5FRV9_9GAMM|nr:response regulator [Legionella sainthelensi]AUH74291.1 DNA-binding response regulator [Legionella sainthelensi]
MAFNNGTIFIVDDDLEICNSFRWLFESVNLNVKTYGNAQNFLDDYDNKQHGCLIIDVRMPIMSGLELLDYLKTIKNKLSVIVVTGYGDVPMAVRAMKAGASDFIMKPVNHQDLLESINNCLKKNQNNILEIDFEFHKRLDSLTKREKQIMDLVIEGKLNKQIAYELDISISTVEVHRANVMKKMNTKTLAELVKVNLLYNTFISQPLN